MLRAHSTYAGVLFCAAEKRFWGLGQHSSGCGWKLKRTSDSTLALVRPVTGAQGTETGVCWVGVGWMLEWAGLSLTMDVA
jgi:hypothetical protein